MDRAPDLPDFDAPPIDEVALGVQFDPIVGFTDAHAGVVWSALREQYPLTEVHPPVNNPVEDLSGPPLIAEPSFRFGIGTQPANRTWLLTHDQTELFQLQDSRVIFNWRQRNDAGYPHLEHVRDQFLAGYGTYRQVLEEVGLRPTTPIQLELSYFNWIVGSDPAYFFRPAASVDDLQPSLEGEEYASHWSFLDKRDGHPVARLRVEFSPAVRLDEASDDGKQARGYRLVLAYNAPLRSGDWESEMDELATYGRDVIVRTFTALTTEAAHAIWGRKK